MTEEIILKKPGFSKEEIDKMKKLQNEHIKKHGITDCNEIIRKEREEKGYSDRDIFKKYLF